MFANHAFTGCVSTDAYWVFDPVTDEELPQPWAVAARWCGRCWRLIPNGSKAYDYSRLVLCDACHYSSHGGDSEGASLADLWAI